MKLTECKKRNLFIYSSSRSLISGDLLKKLIEYSIQFIQDLFNTVNLFPNAILNINPTLYFVHYRHPAL